MCQKYSDKFVSFVKGINLFYIYSKLFQIIFMNYFINFVNN